MPIAIIPPVRTWRAGLRLGAMIHAFLEWLLPIKVCLGLHKTVRSISSLLKPEFTKENQHRLQRPATKDCQRSQSTYLTLAAFHHS
jgi:hypothetical protein